MILILFLSLCLSIVSATNINYTEITPSNFTELQDVESTVPGLNHLFTMTTNFVNVVFQPFSVIEEFLFSIASTAINSNEDPIQSVLSQWQTLASFEVGFVTCFVAGCLFIVFVPLIGLIMCCCRTCCSNCGGEMEQSVKRAKSSWRLCISASLLICTIFIAVPCVFVYLTNEWASDALRRIPTVTDSALDDLSSYITDVPRQLEHVIGEFSKLDESIRDDVDNIGSEIGDPIRDEFLLLTNNTLDRLGDLSNLTQESLNGLEDVQTYTTELSTGMNELNAALISEKSSLDADLNNVACDQNPVCVAVQSSTVLLNPSGADFSAVASIQTEIDNMNNTLNQYDIDGQASDILQTIEDIPESVVNSSTDMTSEILGFLSDINSSLVTEVNNLPLETIDILGDTITDVSESISSALSQYNDQYDSYRYIAGALLASMVAIIVAFYWLGICCGTVSFSPYPSERSGCSNCGGILVMAGVGFTFMFSWLLMILVVIFFTIGGHSERYLCQNMESPYEGLKFVDKFLPTLLDLQIDGEPFNVSLYNTITECEKNASIYNAGGIEQIVNITGLVDTAMAMIDPFRDQINNFTLDLTNIDTYPPELEEALESMKDTGFSNINFTTYIEQIDRGLTSTNLTEYAVFLNSSADNMTATTPPLPPPSQELLDVADLIRAHSYNITLIQTVRVDPLSTTLTRLNDSIRELETTASGFNETVDSLATSLEDLNEDIANNGSAVVSQVVSDFGNEIIDDAIGYMDYIAVQITERFGACRPLFLVYAKMTAILCSYLVEILNGFWFSLGWCVAFLIPSAILAMKLAKFYRVMSEGSDKEDEWNEMEMESMHNTNKKGLSDSGSSPHVKANSEKSGEESNLPASSFRSSPLPSNLVGTELSSVNPLSSNSKGLVNLSTHPSDVEGLADRSPPLSNDKEELVSVTPLPSTDGQSQVEPIAVTPLPSTDGQSQVEPIGVTPLPSTDGQSHVEPIAVTPLPSIDGHSQVEPIAVTPLPSTDGQSQVEPIAVTPLPSTDGQSQVEPIAVTPLPSTDGQSQVKSIAVTPLPSTDGQSQVEPIAVTPLPSTDGQSQVEPIAVTSLPSTDGQSQVEPIAVTPLPSINENNSITPLPSDDVEQVEPTTLTPFPSNGTKLVESLSVAPPPSSGRDRKVEASYNKASGRNVRLERQKLKTRYYEERQKVSGRKVLHVWQQPVWAPFYKSRNISSLTASEVNKDEKWKKSSKVYPAPTPDHYY